MANPFHDPVAVGFGMFSKYGFPEIHYLKIINLVNKGHSFSYNYYYVNHFYQKRNRVFHLPGLKELSISLPSYYLLK